MTVTRAGIQSVDLDGVLRAIDGESLGLMLYGSHARGDARPDSDVDVLQLVAHSPRSYTKGSVSVVAYTPDQVGAMAHEGGLFAWHLRLEGRVLTDDEGLLRAALAEHPGPAFERVLGRLRDLSAVLDIDSTEFGRYANRAIRTARYLVRTGVYARAMEAGGASFAMESAVWTAGSPHLLALLGRETALSETWTMFDAHRLALTRLVGSLVRNPYGSLEALAVCAWEADEQLASLAIQTILPRGGEIEYSTLPPPVL